MYLYLQDAGRHGLMTVDATIVLLSVAIWGLSAISNAISLPNCTASLCLVAPGETWTPAALNVSGSLTVAGTPGVRASTLDLSLLSRATFTPGVCQPTYQHCSSVQIQDLTLVTDLAAPTASSALLPLSLLGPGTPSITYINVTLSLPNSCVSLGLYTNLLCRGTVNSSLVIDRWGVLIHTWSSAAVNARNLNLTCGSPLRPQNQLCSSTLVSQPLELLVALVNSAGMAAGTTSFIHVLSNISLQVCDREPQPVLANLQLLPHAVDGGGGHVPAAAALCGDAGRLVNITNKVVIAGVPSPANPRPELDWAGWCGIVSVELPNTSLQLSNLTLANLPVGPSVFTPLSFFTAAAFIAAFNRRALGYSGFRLLLEDVTMLLPSDEMVWWSAMATDPNLAKDWATNPQTFLVTDASNVSVNVQHLLPARGTYVWRNTQLVSVQQQPPSAPLLVHDTGVLRLNGLGPVVLYIYTNVVPSARVTSSSLLTSPFGVSIHRRVLTLMGSGSVDLSNSMALQRDTVVTGDPYRPQVTLLDLAAEPTRLGLSGPGGQLTLSNLVLGNAAPLLSSLVCGAAARQQGVACHPISLDDMTDPIASSRDVWQAMGLADLDAEDTLPPLYSPALAEALGGLTSLLWFFSIPRAPDLADPSPIASAPLVLLNVTILLPDLEAQAIREVAVGGSTRINLRPDTLDLLRSQLAGQQVLPAAWPPGGFTFPTFSWFGIRGLHVTLAPATPTDPWGRAWADIWNVHLPQLVPSNLTTMVQPDGPLLLTPDLLSPTPDPPSTIPGFASENHPSPLLGAPSLSPGLPAATPEPSPSLAPPSPSPTLPAASLSPKPSPPAHPPGPSPGPFTSKEAVPSACSGCEARVVGVAVGSAIASLLLWGVVVLLVVRWRQRLSSPAALPGCGKAAVALSISSFQAKVSHDKDTNSAADLSQEEALQPLDLKSMQYAPCWWPSTSSNSSGLAEEGKHCKGHGHGLEYQLQDHHQQQQQQMLSTQTASSCRVQAGSNSSGIPGSLDTSSCSRVGHAAAVPASSTPEARPAAGPASQEHPSNTEARTPCSVAASTDLEQAGLEQELSLEEQLGMGAFGTVYRGRWRGMPVAVKRLVFSGLADQLDFTAQRQQVLMEAELNAGLAHPNLVATYAYHFAPVTNSSQSVTDWALLMVCELCCFGSLTDAIDGGRLWDAQEQVPRLAQVLTILSDVAQGMAYVHSRNIIHRDLKPDNVLLQDSPDGVVAKVADLGLGMVLGRHQTHVSNACAGTPLYMAPEVLQGHSSQAGDVYSFGVMAWELLHGCTVWTRLQQITQEPRYLQGLAPHPKLFDHDWRRQPVGPAAAPLQPVLKGLQDLVDCCLLPRPSARPSLQHLVQWLVILVDVHGRQLHSL
ncbi:hypothetical protein QJQ45_014683 [Haematococcus lacustris]|nr:hypothetical protein QJQ45_014683 [Haematococcus lacustris]